AHGEEAYSLGIVLANSIGIEKLRNVRIFATDIDEKAVNTARKGLYREDSMQNVSDPVKKASFLKTDIGYELRQDIRHLVRFGTLDIINGFPISKVDLLFCRNMLIYFEKELQKRVLEKLDFSLKPGGLLVLGKSETLPSSFSSRYEEILDRSRVYRRIS
ncbi:MAG TPA: CheR family methyltransferase, partial [Thermodesulfovibrionales bacterium]|nr:CheR family methyltransferase [Thermodesulfovibrionales bacterium]